MFQPLNPRNLLIALETPKSLNPNGAFSASYDQRIYEKTICHLHVLARAVWHLVSPSFNRNCQSQPNSSDGSHCGDSSNLFDCSGINPTTHGNAGWSFSRSG